MITPDLSVPGPYKTYIEYVKDQEVLAALRQSGAQATALVRSIPEEKGEHRYAPGKWSIKEVLCHLMDAERIFAYRALRFSRNDKTPLSGFEENDYVPQSNAHSRTLTQLAEEMERLRLTSVDLIASCTPDMLRRSGLANKYELTAMVLGYTIAGHERHHCRILTERYLI